MIQGSWRDGANLDDMEQIRGATIQQGWPSSKDCTTTNHYYKSPAVAVPWQNNMI